ncbi:hypothetical protein BD289DRAFT_447826 [Coniella lustricola]|uniref:Uncharacterized protein n=1 Tax=Coniella lustricola TaxID=2025994 RepID=A0A2T2ZSQ5_9PEZI|nr:hypothetical protein BD289DRAFT_447826 [Coniella lustricola]
MKKPHQTERRHLAIKRRCGACSQTISPGEQVTALFEDVHRRFHIWYTKDFKFPELGHLSASTDCFYFCRRPSCAQCANGPDTTTVHVDCLAIFLAYSFKIRSIKVKEALFSLHTSDLYRDPWRQAPLLCLQEQAAFDTSVFHFFVSLYDIPQLRTLPAEIREMIRLSSPRTFFWRAVATISAAYSVDLMAPETVHIRDIGHFNRGEPPISRLHEFESAGPMIIRITIDSDGIRRLERLAERPPSCSESSTCLAYIVELEAAIPQKALLLGGRLKLDIPVSWNSLRIWDTPGPPIKHLHFSPRLTLRSQRIETAIQYRTINLTAISGITLFYSQGMPFGIFAHRIATSSALRSYQHFSKLRQDTSIWIYLPIAAQDTVVCLVLRQTPRGRTNLLVRTRLCGDIILGPQLQPTQESKDYLLAAGASITMIYNELPHYEQVNHIGAYCDTASSQDLQPFEMHTCEHSLETSATYHSAAPLNSVTSITVFRHADGACRGILLEYENHGLRAVGECRIGVDASDHYTEPTRICVGKHDSTALLHEQTHEHVHVAIDSCAGQHGIHEWDCYHMSGVLHFVFSKRSSLIFIAN